MEWSGLEPPSPGLQPGAFPTKLPLQTGSKGLEPSIFSSARKRLIQKLDYEPLLLPMSKTTGVTGVEPVTIRFEAWCSVLAELHAHLITFQHWGFD